MTYPVFPLEFQIPPVAHRAICVLPDPSNPDETGKQGPTVMDGYTSQASGRVSLRLAS